LHYWLFSLILTSLNNSLIPMYLSVKNQAFSQYYWYKHNITFLYTYARWITYIILFYIKLLQRITSIYNCCIVAFSLFNAYNRTFFSIFNFNFVVRFLKYCVRHEKGESMKLSSTVCTNLNRVNLELKIQNIDVNIKSDFDLNIQSNLRIIGNIKDTIRFNLGYIIWKWNALQ
jgi:hypothetical protein